MKMISADVNNGIVPDNRIAIPFLVGIFGACKRERGLQNAHVHPMDNLKIRRSFYDKSLLLSTSC